MTIEEAVGEFGEENRHLITDFFQFLDALEPYVDRPFNRHMALTELLKHRALA